MSVVLCSDLDDLDAHQPPPAPAAGTPSDATAPATDATAPSTDAGSSTSTDPTGGIDPATDPRLDPTQDVPVDPILDFAPDGTAPAPTVGTGYEPIDNFDPSMI